MDGWEQRSDGNGGSLPVACSASGALAIDLGLRLAMARDTEISGALRGQASQVPFSLPRARGLCSWPWAWSGGNKVAGSQCYHIGKRDSEPSGGVEEMSWSGRPMHEALIAMKRHRQLLASASTGSRAKGQVNEGRRG